MAESRVPRPNYTQVPNVVLDEYLPAVSPAEAKVLLWLCRATFGWHREYTDSRYSSLNQIAKRTGLSRGGVIKALKQLHTQSLVRWYIDPATGAKAYSLRLEDEQPQAEVPDETSTQSIPGLVHTVDQASTQSIPGGVHRVDHYKETKEKETKERKERKKARSAAAAPSGSRTCAYCSKDLDALGLDKRYRYCSDECKQAKRSADEQAATAPATGVRELMQAYEAALGYVPEPYAANAKAAKQLLERYPAPCVLATYEALKAEPNGYWSTRPLSLMSMLKQIGPALAAGKVGGWQLQDGRAVEADEDSQRRNGRGTQAQNATAIRMLLRRAEQSGNEDLVKQYRGMLAEAEAV